MASKADKTNPFFTNSVLGIFYNPFYIIRKELYNGILQYAPHFKGRVLDAGCGTKPYIHLFTNASEYIGMDIEVSGNHDSKKHIDVFYDGNTFPFKNAEMDYVFTSETLEHVFNPEKFLSEIYRVMKPNATLLITCPFVCPEHEVPYDFARYTSFAMKHLLNNHGFEIVEEKKSSHFINVIIQLCCIYFYYGIARVPILKHLLFIIFITPLFLFSHVFDFILPRIMKRKDLFLNHIILAKKI